MRASTLRVHGFGRLHDREFRLAPGITFVHGPNESGKSTLHAALAASLFGLAAPGRRTPAVQAAVERYRPWRTDRYATTLELVDEAGRRLRLDWDFDRWSFTVIDAATGHPLTSSVGGGSDTNALCRALYGVSRDAYLRVGCVRQAELGAIGDPTRVREEIERLAGQDASGAGPEQAVGALRAARARLVGLNKSRTNPLPQARARVDRLEAELDEAERARADTEAAVAAGDRDLAAVAELDRRIAEGEAELIAARAASLRSAIDRVGRANQELRLAEEGLAAPPPAPERTASIAAAARRIPALRARVAEGEPVRRRAAAALAGTAEGAAEHAAAERPSRAGWALAAAGAAAILLAPLIGIAAGIAGVVLIVVGLAARRASARAAAEREQRRAAERSRAAAEARAAAAEARAELAGLDAVAAELGDAEAELDALLEPGEGDLLVRAGAACDHARQADQERRGQERTRDRARAELAELLREHSLEELQAQLDRLGDAGEVQKDPPRAGDLTRIERDLGSLRRQREQALLEARTRAATLDERLRTLPDTAELRERLRSAVGERDRLERTEHILRLAEDGLAEAIADTYRDFAPRLNQALEAHLSRVTRGRYTTAYVGEDLSVSLEAPETSAPVPLESTSLGTQRLAQLVLRLELVRLLAPSAEPLPVLLDDPFAHLDRDRLADAVGLLEQISAERQLVVFTTQPEAVALAPSSAAVIDLGTAGLTAAAPLDTARVA